MAFFRMKRLYLSNSILDPISESLPCGSDYKYEDAYLSLEAEVDKVNSMSEDTSTDWSKVRYEAEDILSTKSKDIKIMCWYTYASWKTSGVSGLQQALELFNSLLEEYKEKLFPKSKRVKSSALGWLEELLQNELLDDRYTLVVSLNEENFLELFDSLQRLFSQCIDEDVSLFSKLRSALSRAIKEKEVAEEASSSSSTSSQSTSQSSVAVEFNDIADDNDAAKVLRSMKKNMGLLHNYWRAKESGDLRAIRLVRILSWLDIDSLPLHDNGKTPLNPPSELSLNQIEEHISNEEYVEAFDKIENLIALSPFWLEGHYLAAELLEKMDQKRAALEIKNHLVAYIKADEKILDLTFNDTTPFASLEMKQWLAASMDGVATSTVSAQEDDPKERVIEDAYKKAKKHEIKEAMELLQDAYIGAVNNEDKFHWRLAKAELAIEFNKKEIALALLEDLQKDIERYNLEEWKPELAAKVFSLYLNTFNRTTVDLEDLNSAYTRLCKIDITQALEIKI